MAFGQLPLTLLKLIVSDWDVPEKSITYPLVVMMESENEYDAVCRLPLI